MSSGRLTKIFNDLAEGGKIKMPMVEQSGGADVGWLTDKFGITWMVSIDKAWRRNGSYSYRRASNALSRAARKAG